MMAVWFAYGLDTAPLIQSVQSFRKAGGQRVVIFDDAKNPIQPETVKLINPDIYEQTTFNRNGNLNGIECIFGILESLKSACMRLGEDGAIKVDCDTVFLKLDWVDENKAASGFMGYNQSFFYGMCYYLKLSTIEKVIESFKNRRYRHNSCPEDATISAEVFMNFGGNINIVHFISGACGGWQYEQENEEFSKFLKCYIVTFGNKNKVPNCKCQNERSEIIALAMSKFINNNAVKKIHDQSCIKIFNKEKNIPESINNTGYSLYKQQRLNLIKIKREILFEKMSKNKKNNDKT